MDFFFGRFRDLHDIDSTSLLKMVLALLEMLCELQSGLFGENTALFAEAVGATESYDNSVCWASSKYHF